MTTPHEELARIQNDLAPDARPEMVAMRAADELAEMRGRVNDLAHRLDIQGLRGNVWMEEAKRLNHTIKAHRVMFVVVLVTAVAARVLL